jgi:uncharacterized LabA/DUF88 family protein
VNVDKGRAMDGCRGTVVPAFPPRAVRRSGIALFVDHCNADAAARALGFSIDYQKLVEVLRSNGRLVRAHYYAGLAEGDEYSPLKPVLDWLGYNGFKIVTKAPREVIDRLGRRRVTSSLNVELTIDALELAPRLARLVLLSGDGDLCPMVEAVQRSGVRVTIASTAKARPSILADALRRQADEFIELADLAGLVSRDRPALARRAASKRLLGAGEECGAGNQSSAGTESR